MSELKYTVNLEKDEEGNVSGVNIVWKAVDGTEIEECVVTNSKHLEDLEKRISEIVSNTLRPAEVLSAILSVDGQNSGLDADTFRGLLPSSFALESHNHDTRYYTKSEVDAKISAISTSSGSGTGTGSGSGTGTGSGGTTPVVPVTKTTPTVRLSGPSEVALGGTYTLTASLPSDATGTVTFYQNGNKISGNYQATVASGSASVTNTISSSEGSWNFTCRYNGNDNYNSADSSNSVTINAVNTRLTSLSGSPTSMVYGDEFYVYLKDRNSNPIVGQHISFACQATTNTGSSYTKTYYGTTDTNGRATPQVPFTFEWTQATIVINSSFAGNDTYDGSSTTTSVNYTNS